MRNSPVGSVRSSSLPLLRIQFRVSSKSFTLCSGVRPDAGTLPTLLNLSIASLSSTGTPLLRIQSRAPSISRARSSGLWPRFVGSMESSLRKSPVGSVASSPLPLLRNQFRASSRSFDRCSGERRATNDEPTLSKEGNSSTGSDPCPLIQSSVASISRARSSAVWPRFFGSIESNLRNSPVGSRIPSSLPLLRNQFNVSSKSFARCSGVRRDMGMLPAFSKRFITSSSSGDTPLLRIQSRAPSISRARSSGVCPRFRGSIESTLRNSPVGSMISSFLPLLRSQFKISLRSFALSSGVRREASIEGALLKGVTRSSELTPLPLTQSRAASISRARSSGV